VRLLCPLARMLPLLLLVSMSSSVVFADSASVPASPARRVQIQCQILRARVMDVDAMGFNFHMALPNGFLTLPAQSLNWAPIANDAQAHLLLQYMQPASHPERCSTYTAPILTVQDGKSGLISLPRLSDPGLSKAPWLLVTPDIHDDGTVTLLISPLFQFVRAPGFQGDPPATTSEGFPVKWTVPNGSMIMFTEEPRPVPRPDPHPTVGGLPIIRSSSGHIRNIESTELWVFLTVTVLPASSTESTRHA
jgi:hypothetical protein